MAHDHTAASLRHAWQQQKDTHFSQQCWESGAFLKAILKSIGWRLFQQIHQGINLTLISTLNRTKSNWSNFFSETSKPLALSWIKHRAIPLAKSISRQCDSGCMLKRASFGSSASHIASLQQTLRIWRIVGESATMPIQARVPSKYVFHSSGWWLYFAVKIFKPSACFILHENIYSNNQCMNTKTL